MKAAKKWHADRLLIALILILALYIIFWVSYTDYNYNSFLTGWWDMGIQLSSFYYHVAWPQTMPGLQYLSFASHMDPFELLLLPFFALAPGPTSLLMMQGAALACAAIVVYMLGKRVIGNRYVGFALALAFLVNPGVRGLSVYDFHAEAFLPLFYLLGFYFYMRSRPVLFVASYALLLSVIETSIFLGASLLAGLLVYELFVRHRKEHDVRNKHLLAIGTCIALTLIFFAFYHFSFSALSSSYSAGAYSGMPPDLKLINFNQFQLQSILTPPAFPTGSALLVAIVLFAFGISALLFGFGGYPLRVPLLTLIFLSPWLAEVLLIHNVLFTAFNTEYYAYVIGGAMAAACFGLMKSKIQSRLDTVNKCFFILFGAFMASILALLIAPFSPAAANFFNWLAPQNATGANLVAAVSTLNQGSGVMAQQSIATHLYALEHIEMPRSFNVYAFNPQGITVLNDTFYWFVPRYVILDRNLPDYNSIDTSNFSIEAYLAGNYTPYARYGNVQVYKLANG